MRAGRDEDREAIADADASLRSISRSRLFSVELAALVVFPGERIRRLVWGETQIFAPLAVDADEEKLGNAIELIRARADQDTFVEVMGTMLSMAQLRKKDRPSFVGVIRSAATKEERVVRHPWFVDGFERGEEKGREEGLAPLLFLFERRLARPLRESERKRIELRLLREGPEKLGAAWLAPRKSAKKRAA